jgi:hypothetical protein
MHLVGCLYEDDHDARSLEHKAVQGYSPKCLYLHVLEEPLYGELVHVDADYYD